MDRPRPEPASDGGQGKRLSPGAELVPGFHQRLHGLSEQGRLCRPANAAAGLPPAPEISVRHGSYAWCHKRTYVPACLGNKIAGREGAVCQASMIGERRKPGQRRAGSGKTSCQRWSEVDSNFRFPAMVNLVVVAFVPRGCSGWIGAPGREYRGSARLSCAVSPPRCRRIRVGELHVHPRQIA